MLAGTLAVLNCSAEKTAKQYLPILFHTKKCTQMLAQMGPPLNKLPAMHVGGVVIETMRGRGKQESLTKKVQIRLISSNYS